MSAANFQGGSGLVCMSNGWPLPKGRPHKKQSKRDAWVVFFKGERVPPATPVPNLSRAATVM